ncbi:hypothetical protein [Streptomyces solincola]|nr:hypothetical protein [Streptomyces solincola]
MVEIDDPVAGLPRRRGRQGSGREQHAGDRVGHPPVKRGPGGAALRRPGR